MSELNQQNQYEQQDQQANQQESETKLVCVKCCCDYLKWSAKAGCEMVKCIWQCS